MTQVSHSALLINPDELLTTHEAAAECKLSYNTFVQKRWTGGGPKYLKLGDGKRAPVRYRRSDLMAWLTERQFTNTSQYSVDKTGKLITPPWESGADVKHGASSVENSAQPIQSGGHAVSPSPTTPATPHETR